MCTAIHFPGENPLFGRNLDLEYRYAEQVVVTPRNYPFSLRCGKELKEHYALMGMATVAGGYPLYYEAANEKGLAMAGLNFPGNAVYLPPEEGWENIAPFELIPYLLGSCENISEAIALLKGIRVAAIPFSKAFPLSPLHFLIADREHSIVLETTKDGLQIYENPIGVLTNNPEFPWHLTNLANYMTLSPSQADNRFAEQFRILPYSNGMGAIGLPGDFSSASRFIRAAFVKLNSPDPDIGQFFHILDAAAMPKGSVITPDGRPEITQYSCCMDLKTGVYYYTTYENRRILAVDMHREDLSGDKLLTFPLPQRQSIKLQNGGTTNDP